MSHRFFSLVVCLLSVAIAFAHPIDKKDAMSMAKVFAYQKGLNLSINESHSHRAPSSNGDDSHPGYYIFNSANGQGFVIVSGYDCVYPILGYSDTGSINPDRMPDMLKAYLDDCAAKGDSIYQLEKNLTSEEKPSGQHRVMSQARYPISPLLSNNWSYNAPYNAMAPLINDTIANLGCVTVSLATVMGYYKYPASCDAVEGYVTDTRKLTVEPLQGTTFDWAHMLDNYGLQESNATERKAVSTLMRYVSQSLKADYLPHSTPVNLNRIPQALKFFKYQYSGILNLNKRSINDNENTFYNELLNNRPIIIAGWGAPQGASAHVFVCDGYDQDDYFHIDWGWDGDANGYFRFSNLSPYHSYMAWSYGKDLYAVYGVAPNTPDYPRSTITTLMPYDNLQFNKLTVSNTNKTITVQIYNPTGADNTFYTGIGLYDENHQLKKVLSYDIVTLSSSASLSKEWTVDVTDIEDGTYRIFPISKLYKGDGFWHFDKCNSTYGFAIADVSSGVASLSSGRSVTYDKMVLDDKENLVAGAAREVSMHICNNMMQKLNKRYYLFEDKARLEGAVARIPLCSEGDLQFLYYPKKGTHTIYIATDTARTKSNTIDSLKVTVGAAISYKLKATCTIENRSGKTLYGNSFRAKIKFTNEGATRYHDLAQAMLARFSWYNTEKYMVDLAPGESKEFYYECNNLDYNQEVRFYALYKKTSDDKPEMFTNNALAGTIYITPKRAICMWKNDGKLYATRNSTSKLTIGEDVLALCPTPTPILFTTLPRVTRR